MLLMILQSIFSLVLRLSNDKMVPYLEQYQMIRLKSNSYLLHLIHGFPLYMAFLLSAHLCMKYASVLYRLQSAYDLYPPDRKHKYLSLMHNPKYQVFL